MNIGFHNGGKRESLGALIIRTNKLARAHILSVGINGRCARVMEHSRRSAPLHPNTRTSHVGQSDSNAIQASVTVKPHKEYWDVLGIDGQDVILRCKLPNGTNKEFVLDKEEMERNGVTGLRAGRRIEVWKDPESGKTHYELQRYTKLAMTPLLQSILDTEEAPQQVEGDLQQQKDTVDTASKLNNATGENLDPNRTIIVNIRGHDGKRERIVASKKDGFDIWACIHGSRAPYHGQCVFRSEFDDSQMISDKSDLLGYFAKGESIKTIQRGDYILARHLPQGGLQLHKIHEIELNLDFSHLPFSAEELRKYLES